MKTLEHKVEVLEKDNVLLDADKIDLETEVEDLQDEVTDLKEQVETLKEKIVEKDLTIGRNKKSEQFSSKQDSPSKTRLREKNEVKRSKDS